MTLDTRNALECFDDVAACVHGKSVVMFLDFDGTLAPIVDRPEHATLDADMRAAILRLAQVATVAIVSGRDLDDVRRRIGIEGIWYAGSHGFDIAGPGMARHEHAEGLALLARLDAAEQALRASLQDIEGALLERKRFSVAAHFRLTPEETVPAVESAVDSALAAQPGLRKGYGKKVFELLPAVDWNKGAAVLWLLESVGIGGPHAVPIYIGDDLTDEDAFRVLSDRGLGLVVFAHPRPTAARYRLHDTHEVRQLLERLITTLQRR